MSSICTTASAPFGKGPPVAHTSVGKTIASLKEEFDCWVSRLFPHAIEPLRDCQNTCRNVCHIAFSQSVLSTACESLKGNLIVPRLSFSTHSITVLRTQEDVPCLLPVLTVTSLPGRDRQIRTSITYGKEPKSITLQATLCSGYETSF